MTAARNNALLPRAAGEEGRGVVAIGASRA